jgi:hypothetical protein
MGGTAFPAIGTLSYNWIAGSGVSRCASPGDRFMVYGDDLGRVVMTGFSTGNPTQLIGQQLALTSVDNMTLNANSNSTVISPGSTITLNSETTNLGKFLFSKAPALPNTTVRQPFLQSGTTATQQVTGPNQVVSFAVTFPYQYTTGSQPVVTLTPVYDATQVLLDWCLNALPSRTGFVIRGTAAPIGSGGPVSFQWTSMGV